MVFAYNLAAPIQAILIALQVSYYESRSLLVFCLAYALFMLVIELMEVFLVKGYFTSPSNWFDLSG